MLILGSGTLAQGGRDPLGNTVGNWSLVKPLKPWEASLGLPAVKASSSLPFLSRDRVQERHNDIS